jgi:hypothetical protein
MAGWSSRARRCRSAKHATRRRHLCIQVFSAVNRLPGVTSLNSGPAFVEINPALVELTVALLLDPAAVFRSADGASPSLEAIAVAPGRCPAA